MGITDINNAAGAQNTLTNRINAFLNDLDVDVAAKQAEYAALANNLKGVVASEMRFVAYVDPDIANPTGISGGTFETIRDAVLASPGRSRVLLYLAAGKTHIVDLSISIDGRVLEILGDANNRPTISFAVFSSATHNRIAGFNSPYGGFVRSLNVDFFIQPKDNPALPFSDDRSIFEYTVGLQWSVSLRGFTFSGHSGCCLTYSKEASIVALSIHNGVLDGDCRAMDGPATGVGLLSHRAITLLNGAELSTGTLGTNLLQNT